MNIEIFYDKLLPIKADYKIVLFAHLSTQTIYVGTIKNKCIFMHRMKIYVYILFI